MNRRLVVIGFAAAAVAGAVVPSFAQPSLPVTVHTSTDSGVSIGVGFEGQPVAGASVSDTGRACVGVSEQLPVCTPLQSAANTRQALPVTVRRDSTGTTVAAGVVGIYVSNSGKVCPLVSTQTWQCVELG